MENDVSLIWTVTGVGGALIFYSRFLAQWWVSERKKSSVVPPIFWYLSLVGSLLLLAYGVRIRSPLATLGQNLNLFIYSRNIAFIERERGWLHGRRDRVFHVILGLVTIAGFGFASWTWYREFQVNRDLSTQESVTNWAWLALGVAGQGVFAMRMLVQWWVSERAKQSVVPTIFWYLSVAAATMQGAAYTQRAIYVEPREWIFAAGMLLTLLIYFRNLWFIYFGEDATDSVE